MAFERDWEKYFELTKNSKPRSLLVKALPFVKERKHALDLGAGALNDTIYLLAENFAHVTAVDREPLAKEIASQFPQERFSYVISKLEDLEFPQSVDLINAQYSLPFVSPESFELVWEKIHESLAVGGIFTGQLFGDRDEWVTHTDMTFHTDDRARKLLSGFDLLSFREDEEDRPTSEGVMKHWHVLHFIARK